jgi:hypothetical protein
MVWAFIMRLVRVRRPAHLILYYFITEIIFGESLNYEVPPYATLFILLLSPHSY